MRLDNRVAVITGAGSGIGRAIAIRFAVAGAHVVVADRNDAGARETVDTIAGAHGSAWASVGDVTDDAQVERIAASAVERFGSLDVLVNNAAISEGDGILDLDSAAWDRNVAVDLRAPFLLMRAALRRMTAQRRGAIVNIASVNGLLGLGEYPYSAAKAGLISLTQNAAVEFGRSGVRVNAICPGTVRTPIWKERLAARPDLFDRLARWYPLGRVAEPEEIAAVALFLASDEASFITGAVIVADGGLTAGMGRMLDELGATN